MRCSSWGSLLVVRILTTAASVIIMTHKVSANFRNALEYGLDGHYIALRENHHRKQRSQRRLAQYEAGSAFGSMLSGILCH